MKFVLPIYYTIERKTKKNSTHMIGANWLRNVHYQIKNNVKKYIASEVVAQLPTKYACIEGPYKAHYTYYYKNKATDLMNVGSAASKALLDALQEADVVANDTVLHCVEETFKVGGHDKENPRIEVELVVIPSSN